MPQEGTLIRRFVLVAGTLASIPPLAAPAMADEQRAAYLAGTCNTCHRAATQDAAIPSLTARDAAELLAALQAYRSGTRPEPLMQAVAKSLSEAEASEVAAFLAGQEPAR